MTTIPDLKVDNMLRFKGHRAGSDSLSTVQHAENHGGSRDFLILNVPKARAKLFSLVARGFFLGCSHWECALEALDAATEALDLIKTLEDLLAVPPPKRWKFSHVRHLGDECFWVSLCLAQDLPWEAIMLHSVAGKLRHGGVSTHKPNSCHQRFPGGAPMHGEALSWISTGSPGGQRS